MAIGQRAKLLGARGPIYLTRIKAGKNRQAQHASMAKKFPLNPPHPERICWGCDRYCPASDLACGNGSSRTQHPSELFGEDWLSAGAWDEGSAKAECDAEAEEKLAAVRPKAA